jgi:hypothetical protein
MPRALKQFLKEIIRLLLYVRSLCARLKVCVHTMDDIHAAQGAGKYKLGGPPFKRFMQIACRNRALSLSAAANIRRARSVVIWTIIYVPDSHIFIENRIVKLRCYEKVELYFSDHHANSSVSYNFSSKAAPFLRSTRCLKKKIQGKYQNLFMQGFFLVINEGFYNELSTIAINKIPL